MPIINTNVASTTTITQNGTYDVAPYTSAIVNTPAAPDYFLAFDGYVLQQKTYAKHKFDYVPNFPQYVKAYLYAYAWRYDYTDYSDRRTEGTFPDFSNIINVGAGGFYYAFYLNENRTGVVNFTSLTGCGGYDNTGSFTNAFYGTKITQFNAPNMTSVSQYSFQYAFGNCTSLESVDFSSATSAGDSSFSYAFNNCTSLVSFNFNSLTTCERNAFNYAFQGCTSLVSVSFPALTSLPVPSSAGGANGFGGTFAGCSKLKTVDFGNLITVQQISGLTPFNSSCTSLEKVDLSSLSNFTGTYGGNNSVIGFGGSSLGSVDFPAFNTGSFVGRNKVLQYLASGMTGFVVHFPKNLDPQTGGTTISSLTGYPNFGGTSTVLMFDLPSSKFLTGADTNEYMRNPKYDTNNALCWKVGLMNYQTKYYTSGTSDPVVGTTIYSDAACTTAVTTVSSIA